MLRYARLYAYFLRFSFSRAMEFRLDFFFRIGMDAIWYVVQLAFFKILYLHTPMFGGWDFEQVFVFVAGVFVADAIHMTVFSSNMWWFPIYVNKGDLDYYLVRPVSSLFFLSLRDFAANSFVNLLMALGIMVYALLSYPGELGAGAVLLYLLLLALGVGLHYVLNMIFLLPVFWMHAGTGLRDIFFSLDQYSMRPDGIYRGWVRRVVISVLPFALIVSFPTRALFGGDRLQILLHCVTALAVGGLALALFWRRALRAYSSASS